MAWLEASLVHAPTSCWPLIVLVIVGHLSGALPLSAATIEVNDVCNLHAAIVAANTDGPVGGCPAGSGPDTIRLTENVSLVAIASEADGANGLPSITSRIVIEGNHHIIGRSSVAPDAFRIFHVGETGHLTLDGVGVVGGISASGGGGAFIRGTLLLRNSMIRGNGGDPGGGGLLIYGGAATVVNCVVMENVAFRSGPGGALGGGIAMTEGSLAISFSKIVENRVVAGGECDPMGTCDYAYGGGIAVLGGSARVAQSTVAWNVARSVNARGGGVFSARPVLIENSTVTGNRVDSEGGSVEAGGGFFGAGEIRHCTFYGNEGGGPAESIYAFPLAGSTTLSGTLLAHSVAGHCSGPLIDGGGNLSDDDTCLSSIPATLAGLDPALTDNGGPTPTHALLPDSTAIDAGGDCSLVTDQRGAARAGLCDSGAYEEIGCELAEIEHTVIDESGIFRTCSTAILGPGVVIAAPDLAIQAGYLITLRDGVEVLADSDLVLALFPR